MRSKVRSSQLAGTVAVDWPCRQFQWSLASGIRTGSRPYVRAEPRKDQMPVLQRLATAKEQESLGHLQELTSPVLGKLKEALIFTRLAYAQRRAFGARTHVLDGEVQKLSVLASVWCLE